MRLPTQWTIVGSTEATHSSGAPVCTLILNDRSHDNCHYTLTTISIVQENRRFYSI